MIFQLECVVYLCSERLHFRFFVIIRDWIDVSDFELLSSTYLLVVLMSYRLDHSFVLRHHSS